MPINPDHGPECNGVHSESGPVAEWCPVARERHNARQRGYDAARRAERKAKGLCRDCGQPVWQGAARCRACLDRDHDQVFKYLGTAKGIMTRQRQNSKEARARLDDYKGSGI